MTTLWDKSYTLEKSLFHLNCADEQNSILNSGFIWKYVKIFAINIIIFIISRKMYKYQKYKRFVQYIKRKSMNAWIVKIINCDC